MDWDIASVPSLSGLFSRILRLIYYRMSICDRLDLVLYDVIAVAGILENYCNAPARKNHTLE